jgi:fibronectin-binding autotransporter adhesin
MRASFLSKKIREIHSATAIYERQSSIKPSYQPMKPRFLPIFLATLFVTNTARSAPFTWNGGTGTWDSTTTNWTGVAWGNTSADEAIFGGTAGTVTINTGTGVTANRLTFNTDGYTINGNVAADVLTLAGTTPTVSAGTGISATINAIVAGSAGITKSGAGTLVFNGANSYTGTTTLSAGTLVVGHADALSGALAGSGGADLRLATDSSVTAFTISTGTNNSFTITSDRATSGAGITHVLGSAALGGGSSTVTFAQGGNVTSGTAGVSLTSLSLSAGISAGGSSTTTLNPTTATLAITGNVTRTGATTGSTKVLALSGSIAGNSIQGTISNLDADDVIAVTKSGSSTWALNSTNSNYTGITTISGGVLEVASLANGGSNSSIGASTNAATNLVFGASSASLRFIGSSSVTTDRGFTTSSGTGGGATIDASGTGSATLTLDNTVAIAYGTTNQTRIINLDGTNTGNNTFSKTLANNGTQATSLNKNGVGTWVLDGTVANTHTGTTAINGGTLILAKTAGVNAIGGNLTIGNGGVGLDILQLNASNQIANAGVATFNGSGANAGIFRLNNNNETLAGLASTGGAGIVENGNAAAGTSTLTLDFNTSTRTFTGFLQDNGGSGSGILAITKSGSGTQVLSAANTYTGATSVSGGILRITHGSGLGSTAAGTTVSSAASLEISGGISTGEALTLQGNNTASSANQLVSVSGNNTITSNISTTSGGTNHSITSLADKLSINANVSPIVSGTRPLYLRGAGDGEITGGFNKGSADTAPLTKEGTGTWTFSGTSTYNGSTTISGGTLQVGSGGTTGRLTATSSIINDANLTINRSNAFTQASDLGSGAVISGTGSFTQAGTGTTTLTADNTYSGTTSVNAGTLIVNGIHSGTGAVTVVSGATLGGSGSLAASTTITGILAPGNSIGTLTVGNDVTWQGASAIGSSSNWQYELGLSNSSDLLNLTGTSSEFLKNTSLGSFFNFDFLGSTDTGTFTLVDWESTASLAGDAFGTNFLLTDFTYSNLGGGNTGSFGFNGTSLQFTVVPEPHAALLGGIGLLILLRRRRSSLA